MDKCPICSSPATVKRNPPRSESLINCFRCGNYTLSDIIFNLQDLSEEQIANISGWILTL